MIGDKIILYRKRKGLTQEELADLLEVSRQTVTKWVVVCCQISIISWDYQ